MANVNRHAPIKCHVCDTMYSAPERPTQLDPLSANLTACREDLAKYRVLVEEIAAERDALKSKLAEVERERTELRESLIHAVDLRTACHENERQLWAMRQTANYLGAPFSHEGVQAKYDQLCENQTDVEKRLSSALSELAQVKAKLEGVEKDNERMRWVLDASHAWLKSRDHIRVDLWTGRECDLLRAIVEYDAIDHAISTSKGLADE